MDLSNVFVTLIDFDHRVFESFAPGGRQIEIIQTGDDEDDRFITIDGTPYREDDTFGMLRLGGTEDRVLTIIMFGEPQPQQLMAIAHEFFNRDAQ
ncbi:MAG: hypothetical protein AAFU54_19920 [Chloroflexota bacterium]